MIEQFITCDRMALECIYDTSVDAVADSLKLEVPTTTSRFRPHGVRDLLFPVWWQLAHRLVVARQTMDSRLNQNHAELSIAILAVSLQMLAHGHSLLDELVQILGNLGRHSCSLEDAQNLVSSDALDLSNSVGITKNNTNLRRGQSLLCEFANVVGDFLRGGFDPRGWTAFVRERRRRDSLSGCVHSSHVEEYKEEKSGV